MIASEAQIYTVDRIAILGGIGKGCLVDRTIPIHARTLGLGVPPHVMGVYYRVVRPYRYEPICMLLVQTSPPLVKTHTSNPAFAPLMPAPSVIGAPKRTPPLQAGDAKSDALANIRRPKAVPMTPRPVAVRPA